MSVATATLVYAFGVLCLLAVLAMLLVEVARYRRDVRARFDSQGRPRL